MPAIFNKILIANRGEIALRTMQTCRKMGISTVAIYSNADANALFVDYADEAICLGGLQSIDSYLQQTKIIAAAHQTQAEAIHPGYGFLSENADFARLCAAEGIHFIGPNAQAIDLMGSKIRAKTIVTNLGLPTIPGYAGQDQQIARLIAEAQQIGLPVLIKASAGGGGKGMRIVRQVDELQAAIEGAKREAYAAFGDNSLLLEKYFDESRHIEIQIFGDQHGNVVHCFERECSIQRRYQKIIEESPSPFMDANLRQQMTQAAISIAKAINYDNAGTIEFLVTPDKKFYFLEVNTRLQVEHPVTEMVTGLDLVQWQIEVAQGQVLPMQQKQLAQTGHALECRIYAEDPTNDLLPATGKILRWQMGNTPDVRYDTGITTGSEVSIYYDPMIAKVIVHEPTRAQAIRKMRKALQELVLLGVTTNKDFLVQILSDDIFVKGAFNTNFLKKQFAYKKKVNNIHYFVIAAVLQAWQSREEKRTVLRNLPTAWRNNFYQLQQQAFVYEEKKTAVAYRYQTPYFHFDIDGQAYQVEIAEKTKQSDDNQLIIIIDQHRLAFTICTTTHQIFLHQTTFGTVTLGKVARFPQHIEVKTKGSYRAKMPGEVIRIMVTEGQTVQAGDALLVISSMKMENVLQAHTSGVVEEIYVNAPSFVESNALLLKMKE